MHLPNRCFWWLHRSDNLASIRLLRGDRNSRWVATIGALTFDIAGRVTEPAVKRRCGPASLSMNDASWGIHVSSVADASWRQSARVLSGRGFADRDGAGDAWGAATAGLASLARRTRRRVRHRRPGLGVPGH